jgi:hypothetical protein
MARQRVFGFTGAIEAEQGQGGMGGDTPYCTGLLASGAFFFRLGLRISPALDKRTKRTCGVMVRNLRSGSHSNE